MPNIIYDTMRTIENNLQANAIGLFKPHQSNIIEMVLSIDKDILKTVYIGNLGGIHTTHINKNMGTLHIFPIGKSLLDIMQDPFDFERICNEIYYITPPYTHLCTSV